MRTTTVRFDPETWASLKELTEELGIATADFIRIATVQRLERVRIEHRVIAIEKGLKNLETRLEKLESGFDWLLRRLRVRRPVTTWTR